MRSIFVMAVVFVAGCIIASMFFLFLHHGVASGEKLTLDYVTAASSAAITAIAFCIGVYFVFLSVTAHDHMKEIRLCHSQVQKIGEDADAFRASLVGATEKLRIDTDLTSRMIQDLVSHGDSLFEFALKFLLVNMQQVSNLGDKKSRELMSRMIIEVKRKRSRFHLCNPFCTGTDIITHILTVRELRDKESVRLLRSIERSEKFTIDARKCAREAADEIEISI